MKFLAPLLLSLIILIPAPVFGETLEDCDEGTIACACSGSASDTSSYSEDAEDEASCEAACESAAAEYPDVTAYSLECEVGGELRAITGASLGDSSYTSGESSEPLDAPYLNVPIPGVELTESSFEDGEVSSNWIGEYIAGVYLFAISAGSLIAVVVMMIGGMQYILARGIPAKLNQAKTRIRNAMTGMVLLLGAYTIAFMIDPNTVQFDSLRIKSLDAIFISTEDTYLDTTSTTLNLSDPPHTVSDDPTEGTNGVTYYTQRNNDTDYSCGTTVASSGCGPTSAAMVYHTFGVSEATPSYVAQYFLAEGHRACDASCNCNGTYYSAFNESSVATSNNIKGEQYSIDDTDAIYEALQQDEIFIVSVGPSIFTNGGHFIVLTGVYENGNIMINDPNSGIVEATYEEVFDPIKFAMRMYQN